jgi:hypothetical protein
MIEQHALFRKTVNVGSVVNSRAVGADGLGRMVISHNEDDVWPAIAAASLRFCRCHGLFD